MATIFPGRGTGARNRMSDSGMAVVAAFDVSWAGSTKRFAPPSSHEDMLLKISRGKPSPRATVAKSTTPWSVSAPRCDAPSFAAYVTRRNVVSGDLGPKLAFVRVSVVGQKDFIGTEEPASSSFFRRGRAGLRTRSPA